MSESKWKVGETYKTRDGRVAHVLALYEGFFVGVVCDSSGPCACRWHADTGHMCSNGIDVEYDLMPPSAPRIKRTLWVNLYNNECVKVHILRESADTCAGSNRTACVRIDADIPEGYGLDKDMPPILVRAD